MKKILFVFLISCFCLTIISCGDEPFYKWAPVIAEVTKVTTPSNDPTPNYTFSSTESGTITYGGSCSSSTTSAISGNNTITLVSLSDGTYSNCTITVTDATGNVSNSLTITSFIVDSTAPTVAQVTVVTTPTNVNTPNYTFSTNEAGTITYGGSCSSGTTSATSGNNTITLVSLSEGTYSNCTITVTDSAGNVSNSLTITSFIVDLSAATLVEVTAVTTPTNDTTPDYTFSSSEAGTIIYGGSCSSSTSSATTDNNTITLVSLSEGTYSNCTITVTDNSSNSVTLNISSFVIDTTAPTVSSIYPTDNQSGVLITTDNISVTFSEAMDNTSVTTNTDNTTCSGTLKVSSDNFSGCVQMSSSPSSSNSDMTFTIDPSDNLSRGTTYKIRVTTGVKDSAGNILSSQYETSSGFTTWSGTQQFGPMGDNVAGIVLDSSENIYVAGHVKIDIDGQTVTGGNDYMLMKFNHSGVKQWTKLKGTSNYDSAYGLTIDPSNNLYTFGGYDGDSTNSSDHSQSSDISVVKHDSDGNFQWVKKLDNSSLINRGGDYVKIDSSGNIFTGGGDTVGKFNSSGVKQWMVSQTSGEGIVLDSSGNVYVSEDNVTLTKYNSSGTVQWSRTLSSSDSYSGDGVEGMAIDSSDNIYITGNTSGDLDGNSNANPNSGSIGSWDAFLIKYDSSGNKQWTKQIGTSSSDTGRSVTIDTNDNIYLTGETMGSLDGNTLIGGIDVFLIKYNSSGTKQWTKQFGTTSTDRGVAVATDNSGSVYVAGETGGGFDGNTHSDYSYDCGGTCPDMILVKFNSDGVLQ